MSAATAIPPLVPSWALMWLLAAALFYAGKVASLRGAGLRGWQRTAFALAWAGMDAAPFRDEARHRNDLCPGSFLKPLANLILGVVLLWGIAHRMPHPLAAGWVGMVGLIFALHFGVFGLLAAGWRALGVAVTPIMRCPVAATSLSEFWGRRWNLAFRDLAHRIVFRPVSGRMGHAAATWATFAVSGFAHELVISVPAGAGFGLPTTYFLLQALGVTIERRTGKAAGVAGWLRTHAFTVLPTFMLFHPPFVERVMVPFFRVIGALP